MRNIRTWHTYLGFFIAPSVLFFVLTGAMQLFGWHEAHGAYHPAPVIEKLGRMHKDQVFALGERDGPKPAESAGPLPAPAEHSDADEKTPAGTLALKWYFLAVAMCLMTSTVLGLWIGLTHFRHKRTGLVLLILGTLVPLSLALI